MLLSILELLGGVLLALATLGDVFDTVVVPGGSNATLRVARRSSFLLLPVWKQVRRGEGLSTTFAPLVLVLSFTIWMMLLTLGFGMMVHALGRSFSPAVSSFPQALYIAGSTLATIGMSGTDAMGGARFVVLAGGFCGLAVMTMAVTYLLMVQNSLAARDTGILKLRTSAGNPPCAITLLEKFAAIDQGDDLSEVLKDGRQWCVTVQQSHGAHPSLIYFRSSGTGAGWPAALGALLDLALIVEHCIDLPELTGRAVLLREDGARMANAIVELLQLEVQPREVDATALAELKSRLAARGYHVRSDSECEAFRAARSRLAASAEALAAHIGKPAAPLIPA
jgi:hypothetical protein